MKFSGSMARKNVSNDAKNFTVDQMVNVLVASTHLKNII